MTERPPSEVDEVERYAKALHKWYFADVAALGSKTRWHTEPKDIKDAWREQARCFLAILKGLRVAAESGKQE
jgi:hypothetical protein